jgi:hypothetical protein
VEMRCKIAPEVYEEYVSTNKKGEKVLLVQCMNVLYRSKVASLKEAGDGVEVVRLRVQSVRTLLVGGKVLTICHHVDD